ncbi:hypothetical protein D3C78_1618160 [compost metagenome]
MQAVTTLEENGEIIEEFGAALSACWSSANLVYSMSGQYAARPAFMDLAPIWPDQQPHFA